MEMSLDDIIKQNRGTKRQRGGRRGGSSSRGRISSSPRRPSRGGFGSSRKPSGGVMRGRGRGGIYRSSRTDFGRSSSLKREAFFGSSSTSRKFSSSSSSTGSTKLIVSNLDFGVTDSDILELFSEFGPLKHAGVHYDRSGRSLGSADLIYERRADAIKAMTQYNGVPLDGREMNIQLATSEIPSRSGPRGRGTRIGGSSSSSFRSRGGSPRRRGGPPSRGRGGRRGTGGGKPGAGGRGGGAKKPPTAEELDAELEEYVKSKVSSSEGA